LAGYPAQDIIEPFGGVNILQLTSGDKTVDDSSKFSTSVRSGEQVVVPTDVMQSFA